MTKFGHGLGNIWPNVPESEQFGHLVQKVTIWNKFEKKGFPDGFGIACMNHADTN